MTYYVPQERVDEFIKQTQWIEWYNPATEDFIKQLFDENRWAWNWKIVSNEEYYTKYNSPSWVNTNSNTEKDAINSLSNNVSNAKSTSETTNTTNTINNQNSNTNVSSNTSVTNNDTINWVTTEEQVPTIESKKEWNTINWIETKTPKETKTETQSSSNTESKINKSEAYNGFKELLSKQWVWEDRLKELEAWSEETSIDQDSLNALLNKYWYNSFEDMKWDINAIREYYESNPDATEKDFKEYITANPQIVRSLWLLPALIKSKWGWLLKLLWRPFKKLASSKFVQWLSKAWAWYRWASAVWLLTDVAPDAVDRTKWYVWQSRTLDREWNKLPYWKQFLWWLLNNTEKTMWLWIPSTVMEISNEFWPRYQENLWWEVPRENTQEQQKQGKIDKKIRETYKSSNTYKWLQNLEKLSKKYWDEEMDLAMTLMNSAMTTMNKYWLLNWDNITSEWWFEDFEYDPKRHNWYYKNNWLSIFEMMDALSRLDEINGQ